MEKKLPATVLVRVLQRNGAISLFLSVCVYTCVYTYMCICTYTNVYIYMVIYIEYVYLSRIHMQIHTYI